jgi:hypothetical protein
MTSRIKRIDIKLAEIYSSKFMYIKKKHNLSDERAIVYLIDTYFLDNNTVKLLRDRLSNKISRGCNPSFINSLKSVYIFLGHILRKLRKI